MNGGANSRTYRLAGGGEGVREWRHGPAEPGTWWAQDYYATGPKAGEVADNRRLFPTEWEAKRYAELRESGHLHIGALMRLLDERVEQAQQAARH